MRALNLAHRRTIDHSKESLVKAAEELLEKAKVVDIKSKDFGHSQLRNLIAVALETESPAVVTNFIRYQMGRDKTGKDERGKEKSGKSWSSFPEGGDGEKLGQRFIDEIDSGAVQRALENMPAEVLQDSELKQLARIELIRHFLGFASRYLKFLDLQRGSRPGAANDEGEES